MQRRAFKDHAVILIHTINPYGMAWWRRFNENNVDLNRNFLTSKQDYSGVPDGYEKIREFINPESPPPKKEKWFKLKALNLMRKYGFSNLKQWVAEGQYEYPKAIQYGGDSLQPGPHKLLNWLDRTLGHVQQILAIDLHTGLGPSGYDTLLVSEGMTMDDFNHFERLFPGHVALTQMQALQIIGDLHQGLIDRYDHIKWLALTQKFGTFKPTQVIQASRAENRWTQWGKYMTEAKRHWSRGRCSTFNPRDVVWQHKITSRGRSFQRSKS